MNAIAQDIRVTAPPKRLARVAGALYLLVAVLAGFSHEYATAKVYLPGDAATTGLRVVENAGLVRIGVVSNIFMGLAWLGLAMSLCLLLRHASENLARAMVILVAIGTGIVCLNEVFQFAALLVATEQSYVAGLGAAASNALVLLLFALHHYGALISVVFMGLWLVPLGYLAYKSGMFPKALGVLLVVGGACYVVGMLAVYLVPGFGEAVYAFITLVPTVAEVWMVGYLLAIGVRSSPASTRLRWR